jgi:hypothetical protein
VKFPHLDMIDAALKFEEENPAWPMNWRKVVAAIRVQAFIDLEPLMKEPAIPPVDTLDA